MAVAEAPAPPDPVAAARALESHWVETPVGKVEVKLAVPAGERPSALALLVHGMSPAEEVVWEWGCIVAALRRRKTAVVYPNLHSCDATAPAAKPAPGAVASALEAVVVWARGQADGGAEAPLLVYGKSWGGARALELCLGLSGGGGAAAAGLVLACPAPSKMEDRGALLAKLKIPVLLVWAKDDEIIPFAASEPLLAELRARGPTVFVPAEAGGHSVARMAAASEGLALKLAEWPDLALGPLASGGLLARLAVAGGGAAEAAPAAGAAEEEAKPAARGGAFDLSGLM